MTSPFHEGERAVQARVGARDKIEAIGQRTLRTFMPDQHRELFEKLPFMVLGAHDAALQPQASMLVGRPGFVRSPDPHTLRIDALPAEPVHLAIGAPVGLLGIELETRRRNRMNGTVTEIDARGFTVHVGQSFGNCPQYIQSRSHRFIDDAPGAARTFEHRLPPEAAALVDRADTFFIATAARAAAQVDDVTLGLDVSHRGGKPGFVRRTEHALGSVLTSPEFRGNFYFNTLGNIAVNPRAGILFVDFESGDCLSLRGEAEILWDGPELAAFAGAERFLRVRIASGVFVPGAVPLRWSAPQQARELPATGSWEATDNELRSRRTP